MEDEIANQQLSYFERFKKIKLGELPKEAVPKPKKRLNKISPKKAEQNKQLALSKGDGGLDLWFEERRKEMTGRCALCGGKSEKSNDETYRKSIHHLLERKKFPSVGTNNFNWLEVCFYGNSCHTNIHNRTITWELLFDSNEWKIIEEKLKKVIPFIHPDELKHLPELLKKLFINVNIQ